MGIVKNCHCSAFRLRAQKLHSDVESRFLKKWELVTHTTKLNAESPTDSLETESIKVL